MLPITSLQNPLIKLVRSLQDKKGRREHSLFMAEGLAMLERAQALGWLPEHLIATKPVHIWEGVKPTIVSEKVMAALSAQNNPHDVLATFKLRFAPSIGSPASGVFLALEEIRDPGNLGTILRTAEAAGALGIILVGDCCDPYAPDCVRASTGSIFASAIHLIASKDFTALCRNWPGDVVGSAMTAATDYRSAAYREPLILALGSESRGLSQAVSDACGKLVRIPMKPGVESLNVATAAALMLYQTIKD